MSNDTGWMGTGTESDAAARVIGICRGTAPGPTLICVAGLHGNEPAGVAALRRVFEALAETAPSFRGEIIGPIGNVEALSRGVRYAKEDMNRLFVPARIDEIRSGSRDGNEAKEQRELLDVIHAALDRADGPVCLLDLHTTSGSAAPFAIIGDTPENRAFAEHLPVPVVFGLIGDITGTLTDYINHFGAASLAFEGGRHDDPGSIDRHEAAVWLALSGAGQLGDDSADRIEGARRTLATACAAIPRVLEVCYRHGIDESDDFTMRPGFASFQAVESGQLLASDRNGEILAPVTGRVLLPLYQTLGTEGFFIVQPA